MGIFRQGVSEISFVAVWLAFDRIAQGAKLYSYRSLQAPVLSQLSESKATAQLALFALTTTAVVVRAGPKATAVVAHVGLRAIAVLAYAGLKATAFLAYVGLKATG